jgi:hypothetical protein
MSGWMSPGTPGNKTYRELIRAGATASFTDRFPRSSRQCSLCRDGERFFTNQDPNCNGTEAVCT